MQIPYKWIAVGVVVALLVGMLGMVVWTPATIVGDFNNITLSDGTTIIGSTGINSGSVQESVVTGSDIPLNLAMRATAQSEAGTKITLTINRVYVQSLVDAVWSETTLVEGGTFSPFVTPFDGQLSKTFSVTGAIPTPAGITVNKPVTLQFYIQYNYVITLFTGTILSSGLTNIVPVGTGGAYITPIPQPEKGTLWVGCGTISQGVTVAITGPEQKSGVSYGGFVEFKDITPGVYSVKWSITGYVDQTTTATVTASATKQINAGTWVAGATPPPVVPGTGTKFITITVRDSAYLTGPLISGASVTCNGVTQTTTAGVTTFTGLGAGTYVIRSTKTGFNAASTTVVMTPDSISASDVILMTPVSGGGGGAGNNTTATTDWMPTIILGAIGGVIFLLGVIGYSTRSNPVYLFLGFVALAICLIVGLMLSFNLISFDSGAVITEAVTWLK
jgi:hypothetical protein